jgi:hypothetical protein
LEIIATFNDFTI